MAWVGNRQLAETRIHRWSGGRFAERVSRRIGATLLAVVWIIGISQGASAFECLANKPAGARGKWHAEVVAGKICWFGADWRSFLAKEKAEHARAVNSKATPPTVGPEQPAEPAAASDEADEDKT